MNGGKKKIFSTDALLSSNPPVSSESSISAAGIGGGDATEGAEGKFHDNQEEREKVDEADEPCGEQEGGKEDSGANDESEQLETLQIVDAEMEKEPEGDGVKLAEGYYEIESVRRKRARKVASKGEEYSRMEELYPRFGSVTTKQRVLSGPSSILPEVDEDSVSHLSGKPFFDVVLTKSHISKSYALHITANFAQLLPHGIVPVLLVYKDKNWHMSYIGDSTRPRFSNEWKGFVAENNLKCGDACVFELMENSSGRLKFKVHILRCDLPSELLAVIDSCGTAMDSPIVID